MGYHANTDISHYHQGIHMPGKIGRQPITITRISMYRILYVRKRRFSPLSLPLFAIHFGLLKKQRSPSVLNNELHNSADQPAIVLLYPKNQIPSQISEFRRDTILALMNENEQHFGVKRGSNLSAVGRLMQIFSSNADVR